MAAPARAAPRGSPRRSPPPAQPGRGRRPLARGRATPTGRSTRCCAAAPSWPRSTPTATPPALGAPGARPVARGRARPPSASPCSSGYARCAELAGELAEAARAQREVVAARRAERRRRGRWPTPSAGSPASTTLQGDREPRARRARRVAADGVRRQRTARARPPPSAWSPRATSRAPAATREAVALATTAARRGAARRADRPAGAGPGAEGVARAKGGDFDEGVEAIRAGLSLALEHELTGEAAELYQRLGTALEVAGGLRRRARRR